MNEIFRVLRVQGARTGSKINVKKTKRLDLGINEGKKMMLGNKNIDQVDSFTYLGILVKMVGREDVKRVITKTLDVSFKTEKSLKE